MAAIAPAIKEPEINESDLKLIGEMRGKIIEYRKAEKAGERKPNYNFPKEIQGYWRNVCNEPENINTPEHKLYGETPQRPESPSLNENNWPNPLLHRFLRARKGDVNKAVEMFMATLYWREQFGVDELYSINPMPFNDQIHAIIPHSFHKTDKFGTPIYIQKTGIVNAKEFVDRISDTKLALTHTHFMETVNHLMQQSSEKLGKRIETAVHIIDLKGVGLGHRKTVKFFSITSFIDQNFYPEQLAAIYMINSPSFFPVFWSMCKVFLDPVTQNKIKVLGTNFQTTLTNDLGAENLPVEYGGTCVCNNPGGCVPPIKPIEIAGLQHESQQLIDEVDNEANKINEWKIINIGAGKEHIEKFSITNNEVKNNNNNDSESNKEVNNNSIESINEYQLWWSFIITSKDINFTLKFIPSQNREYPIIPQPTHKLQAKNDPYRGIYTIPQGLNGELYIIFDNKMSYFSSKSVKLKCALKQIQQQIQGEKITNHANANAN